jgi:hypothetical protein
VAPGNAPRGQPEALAELSQRVRVPIQSPVLANGNFRQRAEDRCLSGGADLQEFVRKGAGASEFSKIQTTCANRIGVVFTIINRISYCNIWDNALIIYMQ